MAPAAYRRTYAAEQPFGATVAPDGPSSGPCTAAEPAWVTEFEGGLPDTGPHLVIDHVNLTQPWQIAEDAVLFLTSAAWSERR